MSRVFCRRVVVRFDDADYVGVLYFPQQIHYFMQTLDDFFREALGLPWRDMLDRDGLVLPTVNVRVDYHYPLRLGEEADISVRVAHLGGRSVRFHYEVTQVSGGRRTCTAEHAVVFCARDTWKPVPIPPRYRAALEGYLVAK